MASYGDIQGLEPSQKKVIRRIIRVGQKRGQQAGMSARERRKMINTALAVGYTEARYSNPQGGDRDSGGWRQERRMYYSNPTNLTASANRFYDEYLSDADKGAPLGVRAQQVQQSGTPNVWDDLAPMANQIRRQFSGKGASYEPGRSRLKGELVTAPGVDNSAVRQQLREEYVLGPKTHQDFMQTALGLKEAADVPAKSTLKLRHTKAGGGAQASGSAKGLRIRPDQNAGAKQLAEWATKGVYGSGERTPAQNAAVGGAQGSDHLTTNRRASAVDAKYGTGKMIAKRLGLGKVWKPGTYDRHTIKVDGRLYSVQILENVEGHYDHTHLGVQRVG